jgi:flagellum-specific peptidoglycan hydrolase FlgJ
MVQPKKKRSHANKEFKSSTKNKKKEKKFKKKYVQQENEETNEELSSSSEEEPPKKGRAIVRRAQTTCAMLLLPKGARCCCCEDKKVCAVGTVFEGNRELWKQWIDSRACETVTKQGLVSHGRNHYDQCVIIVVQWAFQRGAINRDKQFQRPSSSKTIGTPDIIRLQEYLDDSNEEQSTNKKLMDTALTTPQSDSNDQDAEMMALQVVQMIQKVHSEFGVNVRDILQEISLNPDKWQESTLLQLYDGKPVLTSNGLVML